MPYPINDVIKHSNSDDVMPYLPPTTNDVIKHSNSDDVMPYLPPTTNDVIKDTDVMPYLPKPWCPVFRLRKEAKTLSMKVLFPLLAALKSSESLPILLGCPHSSVS